MINFDTSDNHSEGDRMVSRRFISYQVTLGAIVEALAALPVMVLSYRPLSDADYREWMSLPLNRRAVADATLELIARGTTDYGTILAVLRLEQSPKLARYDAEYARALILTARRMGIEIRDDGTIDAGEKVVAASPNKRYTRAHDTRTRKAFKKPVVVPFENPATRETEIVDETPDAPVTQRLKTPGWIEFIRGAEAEGCEAHWYRNAIDGAKIAGRVMIEMKRLTNYMAKAGVAIATWAPMLGRIFARMKVGTSSRDLLVNLETIEPALKQAVIRRMPAAVPMVSGRRAGGQESGARVRREPQSDRHASHDPRASAAILAGQQGPRIATPAGEAGAARVRAILRTRAAA